jgi:hypothetical protein
MSTDNTSALTPPPTPTSDQNPTPTLTLQEVAAHFAQWRSEKKRGERVPEQLWSEAIALVDRYGVSQVTRTLRLSGQDLNRRRGIASSGQRRRRGGRLQSFVEVDPAVVAQAQRPQVAPGSMELIRADGLRLRIEPGDGVDALTVLERFMGVR